MSLSKEMIFIGTLRYVVNFYILFDVLIQECVLFYIKNKVLRVNVLLNDLLVRLRYIHMLDATAAIIYTRLEPSDEDGQLRLRLYT